MPWLNMESQYLERWLHTGPWGTWHSFFVRCGYILVGFGAGWVAVVATLGSVSVYPLPNTLVHMYFWPTSAALLTNTCIFLWARTYGWKIRFSQRVNILFAFNLEGVSNHSRFEPKLHSLINDIRNQIDSHGLGNAISIIVAPPDVRFPDRSAAEAKTTLGLTGSTLVVWGYATRRHGNRVKFATQFSYEFGHPSGINREHARVLFGRHVGKVLSSGLFSEMILDTADFQRQLPPTAYLILAMTSLSLQKTEQARQFAKSFLEYYEGEHDLVRKKGLGRASLTAEDIFVAATKEYAATLSTDASDGDYDELIDCWSSVLRYKPNDYFAHLNLAYIYESLGKRTEATKHHESSVSNAPKGIHEHIFNSAYFALLAGRFADALSAYLSIPDDTSTNVLPVCVFLSKQYDETKELQLLFAEGYIAWRWSDKKVGRRLLKQFEKRADVDKFQTLKTFVQELIYPKSVPDQFK